MKRTSVLPVTKPQFYEYAATVALVYRSPNTPVAGFLDQLIFFRSTDFFLDELIYLTKAKKIDILLEDFNIDTFDSDASEKLHDILSNYSKVITVSGKGTNSLRWSIIG